LNAPKSTKTWIVNFEMFCFAKWSSMALYNRYWLVPGPFCLLDVIPITSNKWLTNICEFIRLIGVFSVLFVSSSSHKNQWKCQVNNLVPTKTVIKKVFLELCLLVLQNDIPPCLLGNPHGYIEE
jgi:hypothetical protein